MEMSKEERFFALGREKFNKEIDIVRFLRQFREYKLIVRSAVDPERYDIFKSQARYGLLAEKEI